MCRDAVWTVDEVASYLKFLGFPDQAPVFKEQEIDGLSLLLLKRMDVLCGLSMKLGMCAKSCACHFDNGLCCCRAGTENLRPRSATANDSRPRVNKSKRYNTARIFTHVTENISHVLLFLIWLVKHDKRSQAPVSSNTHRVIEYTNKFNTNRLL